jgi:4a-hydroxytetrahydrobiopterin dehydratase
MKNERCEACRVGMKTLTAQEAEDALQVLPGWTHDANQNAIVKTFSFKGYYATIAFLNAVAWIAHQEKHHPEMIVSFNKLIISYHTHEAGGITRNDLICAAKVDALLEVQPAS